MKNITRRKFLKFLSLTSGSFLLPSIITGKNLDDLYSHSVVEEEIITLAKTAKVAFYKRQYPEAEKLYKSLIASQPENVAWYDGLRKVYGAEQKPLEIIELYKAGLERNANQTVFYDRLARSLNSVAAGNHKAEATYIERSGDNKMFLTAALLYIQAIARQPRKKYLYYGLLDTMRYAERKKRDEFTAIVQSSIEKVSDSIRDEWEKKRYCRHKNEFEFLSTDKMIKKMAHRQRRELYFEKEIAERKENIIRQNRRLVSLKEAELRESIPVDAISISPIAAFVTTTNIDIETSIRNLQEFLYESWMNDKNNTHIFGQLVKSYKGKRNYGNLVDIYRIKFKDQPNFWSGIGLASSLVKLGTADAAKEALDLYTQCITKVDHWTDKNLEAAYVGKANSLILLKRYQEARESLLEALSLVYGCGNVAGRMIAKYATIYRLEGEENKAISILKSKLYDDFDDVLEDAIMKYIRPDENENREIWETQKLYPVKNEKYMKLDLLYALVKVYKQAGDDALIPAVMAEIKTLDPNSLFKIS